MKKKTKAKLEKRRREVATAIVDDIMQGWKGKAERLVLEVDGREDGGWGHRPLIDRIKAKLDELDVD